MKLSPRLLLESPYSIGLAYENLTLKVLKQYSFCLKHTGGTGDSGQDFMGHWKLSSKTVPVVGQCKCYKTPLGPRDVREFEDVLYRKFVKLGHKFIYDPPNESHIGVMVSKSWFSKAALKTFHSSQLAMIFMQVTEDVPTSILNNKADDLEDFSENTTSALSCDSRGDEASENTLEVGRAGAMNTTKDDFGIVGEMALNAVAKNVVGDVRLVWKMAAWRNRPRRRLILVSD